MKYQNPSSYHACQFLQDFLKLKLLKGSIHWFSYNPTSIHHDFGHLNNIESLLFSAHILPKYTTNILNGFQQNLAAGSLFCILYVPHTNSYMRMENFQLFEKFGELRHFYNFIFLHHGAPLSKYVHMLNEYPIIPILPKSAKGEGTPNYSPTTTYPYFLYCYKC